VSARPTIVIAGGGTGGHVFPGLAVADALEKLADVEVVFVGTAKGLEHRVVPARGYPLELLEVAPMKGGGVARAVRGGLVAARAMGDAAKLVARLRPSAVLSVGGYAAGPVSLASALRGVPLAVFEPNSAVGMTNRWLAPFARRAYVAWEDAGARFRKGAARVLGVPLRAGFVARPYAARGTSRVLVMGGSQGAAALNERLPQAIALAAQGLAEISVVHQAGRDRDADVKKAYAREGVSQSSNVLVAPFFDDVATQIAGADVVVARAGAVTVAEIAAIGRAAILVPFPFAADDHQAKNAEALARAGGAVAIRQEAADSVRLAREIVRLLSDDALRVKMAEAARAHGRPGAAIEVAADLLELAKIPLGRAQGSARGANGKNARTEAN
jgi:UDP-N-acetylglucosamine--N-acetylmuramyl-(pentapeptide) pyrophosphoryl-undecaprenol N-acetylglucosamine transferase